MGVFISKENNQTPAFPAADCDGRKDALYFISAQDVWNKWLTELVIDQLLVLLVGHSTSLLSGFSRCETTACPKNKHVFSKI